MTNGSLNTFGTAGGYAANTPIEVTLKGEDLEAASTGDGDKVIKVFVKDIGKNWSI